MTTPGTPPGFRPPGEVPELHGTPIAAPKPVGRKLLPLMALFAVLAVVGAVGFFVTLDGDERIGAIVDGGGGGITLNPPVFATASAAPAGPVPEPVTYRGTGSKTIDVRKPENGTVLAYVKGRNTGGVFTVTALDSAGRTVGLVVSAMKPYEGVRLLDTLRVLETSRLKIEATGPWVVELRSVRTVRTFGTATSGTGDSVVRYTGLAGTAAIKGGAKFEQFTVTAHVNGFPRLLVVAGDAFDGTKPMPAGPVLVEVKAPGRWSISVS